MKRTVYVVNVSHHDLAEANKFGELIYLTEGKGVNIFDVKRMISEMKPKLENSTEDDLLLLSGSPVLNIIASQILMFKHGQINLMIYDIRSRLYTIRTIIDRDVC